MAEQRPEDLPSPAQIRAARALLGWSQQKLADGSGIGRRTVAAYEKGGEKVTTASVTSMKMALEKGGAGFSSPEEAEGVHRVGG